MYKLYISLCNTFVAYTHVWLCSVCHFPRLSSAREGSVLLDELQLQISLSLDRDTTTCGALGMDCFPLLRPLLLLQEERWKK